MEKKISLLEIEAIVDHVHMMLDCPDKAALSWAMNLLKGISSRRLNLMYPDVRMDAQTLQFWQAGFASKIVPPSAMQATSSYIRSQWDRLESFDGPNKLKA
jgi:REP element-mobilizing transposase RayT